MLHDVHVTTSYMNGTMIQLDHVPATNFLEGLAISSIIMCREITSNV